MDMLSVRYACPFFVLDDVIRLGQLQEFVAEVTKTIYEEKKEKVRWEYYLHKVFDKSWSDYLGMCKDDVESHQMSNEDIKGVVDESRSILDLF